MRLLNLFGVAFSLLTILPFFRGHVREDELRESVVFFPIVGLVIGLCGYFLVCFFRFFFGEGLSAILYVCFVSIITGGFHLDGLSDTFDAFAAKSKGEKVKDYERRISIMEQGTVGPIGALSLFFVLLLKIEILKEIIIRDSFSSMIPLIPCVSRSSLSIPMYFGKSAKERGLGKIFIGRIGRRSFVVTLLLCEIIIIFAMAKSEWLSFAIFSSLVSFFSGYLLLRIFERRFGGITGDNLGATNEIVEILFPLYFLLLESANLSFLRFMR